MLALALIGGRVLLVLRGKYIKGLTRKNWRIVSAPEITSGCMN